MDIDELALRFPDLDMRKRSPMLFRLNGVGFGLYGRRDADRETGTYVKSHCFCFLWIPLLPISSYRVADADRGWYILGKQPTNGAERLVRGLVATGVVVLLLSLAWGGVTSSTWYRDRETWESAQRAIDSGRLAPAARNLRRVAQHNPRLRTDARKALEDLVATVTPDTDADDAKTVFDAAGDQHDTDGPAAANLWTSITSYATSATRMTTRSRVDFLDAFTRLAPTPETAAGTRRALLEKAATAQTPDAWAISEFATMLEADGDLAQCEKLLEPRKSSLGDLEGARILGQIYARQGRLEESFTLLDPYVNGRLAGLKKAEAAFESSYQEAQNDALERLNNGAGGRAWYDRYDGAAESKQRAMVDEWLGKAVEGNARFIAARDDYFAAAAIVPVAMDLGIVRMQRARAMPRKDEARRELEAAESVFRAIHGAAQGDPDYRLAMARVAFWLGKPDECQAHLDAALAASDDPFTAHMEIGGVLTSLGESSAAAAHWEQAYECAPGDAEHANAATAIASTLCRTDPEKALVWFERASTELPIVAASYAAARAHVALAAGDTETATAELTQALALYDRVPENPATLNNSALVAQDLAALTGRAASFEDAAARLRKAVAAMPTDVIVMQNAASILAALANVHVLGDVDDLTAGADALQATTYDDAPGRDALVRRLAEQAEMVEAARILDRCLALAGNNADVVVARMNVAAQTRDAEALRAVLAHVQAHPPEIADAHRRYIEALAEPVEAAPAEAALQRLWSRLRSAPPAAVDERQRLALQMSVVAAATAADVAGADLDAGTLEGLSLDALERMAHESHASHPCSATRRAERGIATLRLHHLLVTSDVEYAAQSAQHAAHIGPALLIAEALHQRADLRKRVRTTAEFARLLAMHEESARNFPGELGAPSWALLRFGTPAQAKIARDSEGDDVDELTTAILVECVPYFANVALQQAWIQRRAGHEAAADATLAACNALGSAIPYRD